MSPPYRVIADQSIQRNHPRLILRDTDLAHLQTLVQSDPIARQYYQSIKASADKLLTKPLVTYTLVGTTPLLLNVSRDVLNRMYTLGLVYRMEHDARYAVRATQEMLNVATFPDWHPAHFLDTAEMTHAVAIGFDWVYDTLSPDFTLNIRDLFAVLD